VSEGGKEGKKKGMPRKRERKGKKRELGPMASQPRACSNRRSREGEEKALRKEKGKRRRHANPPFRLWRSIGKGKGKRKKHEEKMKEKGGNWYCVDLDGAL